MDRSSLLTRRRALGLTLGAGAAALAGSGVIATTTASAAGGDEGRGPGVFAVPAVVTARGSGTVTASPLDPEDTPTEPWGSVTVSGFPWELVPRVGDHVAVTNSVEGLALAAVPLCTWVIDVPDVDAGRYLLGDRTTVPIEQVVGEPAGELATAASSRYALAVALLDTDLADSLVLQVRLPADGSERPNT